MYLLIILIIIVVYFNLLKKLNKTINSNFYSFRSENTSCKSLVRGPLFRANDSRLSRFAPLEEPVSFWLFCCRGRHLRHLIPIPILRFWPLGLTCLWLQLSCLSIINLATRLAGPALPCSSFMARYVLAWPYNHDLARLLASALTLALTLALRSTNSWENGAPKCLFLWFAAEVMRASPQPSLLPRPGVSFFISFFHFFFTGNWKPVSCLTNPSSVSQNLSFSAHVRPEPAFSGCCLFVTLVRTFFYFYFFIPVFFYIFLSLCFSHKMLPLSLLEVY